MAELLLFFGGLCLGIVLGVFGLIVWVARGLY